MRRQFFILLAAVLTFIFSGCAAADGFISQDNNDFAITIADSTVQIVDVRSSGEFADGHMAGAINIDVNGNDFENGADELLSRNRAVAVYCRSGARSKRAAKCLAAKGFKVYELDKGLINWDGQTVK